MAQTLISENQNAISPKTFTETRFGDTTTKAMTHCGIAEIHSRGM